MSPLGRRREKKVLSALFSSSNKLVYSMSKEQQHVKWRAYRHHAEPDWYCKTNSSHYFSAIVLAAENICWCWSRLTWAH